MTALHQYERLEAVAHVRHGFDASWDEVIVQLGNATLVLSDTSGNPLSHWSLAAMRRADLQDGQATYDLTPDGQDQLATDDPDMIAALAKIEQAVVTRQQPPKRSVRRVVQGVSVLAILAAGVWGAGQLPRHAADAMSDAQLDDLGARMLTALSQITPLCTGPEGVAALGMLERHLADLGDVALHVAPMDRDYPLALPGDIYVLPESMVSRAGSADEIAGHVIATTAATVADPVHTMVLETAGFGQAASLLMGRAMSDGSIRQATQTLTTRWVPTPAADTALQAFDIAGISAAPFAGTAIAAEMGLANTLNKKDPYTEGSLVDLMPDGAFLGLQAICD